MTAYTYTPTLEGWAIANAPAATQVKTTARRIELKPATPNSSVAEPPMVKTTTQVKQENLQKPRTVKQCWMLHSFTGCYIPQEMTREDASLILDGITTVMKKSPEGGKVEDPLAKYCAGKYKELSDWVAHGCCVAKTKEARWAMEGRVPSAEPKKTAPRRKKVTAQPQQGAEQLRMMVIRNAMVADEKHLSAAFAALTK